MSKSILTDTDQEHFRVTRSSSFLNHSSNVTGSTDQKTSPSQIDFTALGKRNDNDSDNEERDRDKDEFCVSRSSSFLNHTCGIAGPSTEKTNPNKVEFSALSEELDIDNDQSSGNGTPKNGSLIENDPSVKITKQNSTCLSEINYQRNYWNNWAARSLSKGTRNSRRAANNHRGYCLRDNYDFRPQQVQYQYYPLLGQQYIWQVNGSKTRLPKYSQMYGTQVQYNQAYQTRGANRYLFNSDGHFNGNIFPQHINNNNNHFYGWDQNSGAGFIRNSTTSGQNNFRYLPPGQEQNYIFFQPKQLQEQVQLQKLSSQQTCEIDSSESTSVNTSLVSNSPSSICSPYNSSTAPMSAIVSKRNEQ